MPRTCLARGAQRSTRAAAVGCAPRAASGRIGAARRGHSAAVAARARPLLARMGLIYCALPTHSVPGTHGGAQRAVVGGDIAQIGRNWDLEVEGRWPLKQIQWVGVPGGCCARPTWLALRWEDHAGTSVGKWRQMRRFGAPRQRSRARGATRDAEAYGAAMRPCRRGAAAAARPVSAPMGTTQCATPACRRPARTAARRRAQRARGRASPTGDRPAFAPTAPPHRTLRRIWRCRAAPMV